jgi:hypothetical protein
LPDLVDDPGGVAAADMEVLLFAPFLAGLDDIDRDAKAGPYVVVVDACGHHVDEHVVVAELGDIHHFLLESRRRLTEALLSDQPRVHLRRNLAEWGSITDIV